MRRLLFICFFAFLVLSACKPHSQEAAAQSGGPAVVVSVSSDGRFALSSHLDNRIVLWNLERKEKFLVSEDANIYSAYFVRGAELFLWQGLDDVVHVQGVNKEEFDSFPHFPTYGHVLSADLKHYVSCDADWNLFYDSGDAMKHVKQDGGSPSFLGQGKLLNLTLADEGNLLLSAGRGFDIPDNLPITAEGAVRPEQTYSDYAGVVLWDLSSGRPLFKFPGNSAKTNATLSPNGQYVVSGCEGGSSFVWEASSGKLLHEDASLYHGILNKNDSDDYENWTFDDTGLIPPPNDLNASVGGATLAIKFIDPQHYLRFLTYSPYAVLFHIDNPLPLKYLYLGRDPLPAVRDYHRNAAMDTAPDAGILVMGQQYGGGIIVYRYDSETQELNKVWEEDRQ